MPFKVRISDSRSRFSSTHFLYKHHKCSRLHGHNYLVKLEVEGELNDQFFVVDFFELKQALKVIIDSLDHALLLPSKSKDIQIKRIDGQIHVDFNDKHYEFPEIDTRSLPIQATTAELLAKYIHDELKVSFEAYKLSVEVAESEGSTAIYYED